MDPNTILLIVFAVMMLFCCGGLGRVFRRRNNGEKYFNPKEHAGADAAGVSVAGKQQKTGHGGCCH